jgi:excisionase family DNA binding protein
VLSRHIFLQVTMKEKDTLEDKIKRPFEENKLLTVTEVAELLRICRFSVYNLVKRKELSAMKVLNKLRFDITSVEQYLEKQRIHIEEK